MSCTYVCVYTNVFMLCCLLLHACTDGCNAPPCQVTACLHWSSRVCCWKYGKAVVIHTLGPVWSTFLPFGMQDFQKWLVDVTPEKAVPKCWSAQNLSTCVCLFLWVGMRTMGVHMHVGVDSAKVYCNDHVVSHLCPLQVGLAQLCTRCW